MCVFTSRPGVCGYRVVCGVAWPAPGVLCYWWQDVFVFCVISPECFAKLMFVRPYAGGLCNSAWRDFHGFR